MEHVELVIHGKVQGVCYRAEAQEKAQALGIVGFARNNPDRTVSIVAQGPRPALEQFIAWCQRGPTHARVTHIDKKIIPSSTEHEEHFNDFQIY